MTKCLEDGLDGLSATMIKFQQRSISELRKRTNSYISHNKADDDYEIWWKAPEELLDGS